MKFKSLHDGRKVPILGVGTGELGFPRTRAGEELRAIETALDLGYTHIDTAEVYGGGGRSEEIIGQAIRSHPRESLFITTKVAKEHLRYDQVLRAMDGSLKRLGTDYVDLYLIHAPDPRVPLEETFRALNELVEQGKTRYIGVSNFGRAQMEEAFRLTKSLLATNQVHYSLLAREPEENAVLAFCEQHDILLTAYSPLENGLVLNQELVKRIAENHGATPAQVALAWLLQKPKVITIPESADAEHLKENLEALDLELSAEEIRELDHLRELVH